MAATTLVSGNLLQNRLEPKWLREDADGYADDAYHGGYWFVSFLEPPPSLPQFDEPSASPLKGEDGIGCAP